MEIVEMNTNCDDEFNNPDNTQIGMEIIISTLHLLFSLFIGAFNRTHQ